MDEQYYVNLRDRYRPTQTRLIFIAESPPSSGKYFYDPEGLTAEPLFRALMCDVLERQVASKTDGLKAFQEEGYLLLDATYVPVNKGLSNGERDQIVLAGYEGLTRELVALSPQKSTPIILIKKNVCVLLEAKLLHDGFIVRNNGIVVPFPSRWQERRFREAIKQILG